MYIKFEDWDLISSSTRSHPLIFQRLENRHILLSGGKIDTDEDLERLLDKCDLSGCRKLEKCAEVKKELKKKYLHDHLFIRLITLFNNKLRTRFLNDHIKRYKLMPFHPILRKPTIKQLAINKFYADFDFLQDSKTGLIWLKAEDEAKLMAISKDADFLVFEDRKEGELAHYGRMVITKAAPPPLVDPTTLSPTPIPTSASTSASASVSNSNSNSASNSAFTSISISTSTSIPTSTLHTTSSQISSCTSSVASPPSPPSPPGSHLGVHALVDVDLDDVLLDQVSLPVIDVLSDLTPPPVAKLASHVRTNMFF
ncbi:unnamed protein product [Ambrosiozyma monospora]|uniref:Unnamed protein product n=1 Tax=Ambrosiozyma monospora TaxID=43982 RepID=A0A9W7DDQ0_AMBMO|nr:unnamed protein product [Ambrosiozyma monospora]